MRDIIKEIINEELTSNTKKDEVNRSKSLKPFFGKKVLIRANRKGTNVGIVKDTDNVFVYLTGSCKLWRWQCKEGVSLESLAVHGIGKGTITSTVCEHDCLRLDDICGITEISDLVYDEIVNWVNDD